MDLALQLLFTGIGIGAVYALVALGFVLIFRATNVVNFAQGEFSMVAAYLMVVSRSKPVCPIGRPSSLRCSAWRCSVSSSISASIIRCVTAPICL